ncbi:unnamed protein product [Paramecium sonneborni]|uniref:Transmembrane protein n=1 Tax=Paramecium sonneborni TaxID=65129 RepID=A0A8S1RPL1_9CILI|nr:unnamed protein product [Paramecium sonneborni]
MNKIIYNQQNQVQKTYSHLICIQNYGKKLKYMVISQSQKQQIQLQQQSLYIITFSKEDVFNKRINRNWSNKIKLKNPFLNSSTNQQLRRALNSYIHELDLYNLIKKKKLKSHFSLQINYYNQSNSQNFKKIQNSYFSNKILLHYVIFIIILGCKAPIKIFGDLYGQYNYFLRHFDLWGSPFLDGKDCDIEACDYLFLGSFMVRGTNQLEIILILLAQRLNILNLYIQQEEIMKINGQMISFDFQKNVLIGQVKIQNLIILYFLKLINYLNGYLQLQLLKIKQFVYKQFIKFCE